MMRRAQQRASQLERLEDRQLLAIGPLLGGILANDGALLTNGQVRDTAPHDLTFRFQDGQTIDAATLDAIQITRAGGDNQFDSSSAVSDLGSDGAVVLQLNAVNPGPNGNVISLSVTRSDHGDGSASTVVVDGNSVSVDLNINANGSATATDLLAAINGNAEASALLSASIVGGNPSEDLTFFPNTTVNLGGYNQATATSDFNSLSPLLVEFTAVALGPAGNGVSIVVTGSDHGDGSLPTVDVSDSQISVDLNTNPIALSTAQDVLTALAGNNEASALVTAAIRVGSGTADVASPTINYSPITLGGANDVTVEPGFIGLGDSPNEIVVRFAETLPDDHYAISILGTGFGALRNMDGVAIGDRTDDFVDDGSDFNTAFELDLGAQIISVVPQPMERLPNGSLLQHRDRIDVYFNNDELTDSATEPRFYQLILTQDSVSNTDDEVILPASVSYDSALNKATLTFAADLASYGTEPGTFRLRIGTDEARPDAPITLNPSAQAITDFNSAGAVEVTFTAVPTGELGNEIRLEVTKSDHSTSGAPSGPVIRITGSVIQVDLDTSPGSETTADDLVSILNSNLFAATLLTAEVTAGDGSTDIATPDATYSPVALAVEGLGDTFDNAIQLGPSLVIGGAAVEINGGSLTVTDGTGASAFLVVPMDPLLDANGVAQLVADTVNASALATTASVNGTTVSFSSIVVINTTSELLRVKAFQSVVISSGIEAQEYGLNLPGDSEEAGHRDIDDVTSIESHLAGLADNVDGISTIFYNFRSDYGVDPLGNTLANLITAEQQDLARRVFEMYSSFLGVQFVETETSGLTVATGDMRAIVPTITTGPSDAVTGTSGFGVAVMDASERWDNSFVGITDSVANPSWFRVAMREVGKLLGLSSSNELTALTLTGSEAENTFDNQTPEPVFPGDNDIVHGQHLFRPEGKDIDMVRFEITETGFFSVETVAERNLVSSSLDTVVRLYDEDPESGARTLLAQNDDYYSNDSYIGLDLKPGIYYVGVSASGNDDYNPEVPDSGFGGTTQGDYDLRINFRPDADNSIVDLDNGNNTPLDGDADGTPGGVYNYWFRTQTPINTIVVDKTAPGPGDGSVVDPYNSIAVALNNVDPGDIVRIVGNGGGDLDVSTVADNEPYEIGYDNLGRSLSDGAELEVPRDVTVMIDASAIVKMRRTRIDVGSSSSVVDRSGGSLQVLGTPHLLNSQGEMILARDGTPVEGNVIFTSFNDSATGLDGSSFPIAAGAGDWGGLVFRNDLDDADDRTNHENNGIFLNYVNHADIRYGGGTVVIDSVAQVLAPVHLVDARPTISFNSISLSADAAISASPNSFEESNFHAPEFQFAPFTSDYQRVGPEVHGNTITNNSINGMFVRVSTPAGSGVLPLTVSGRFDDTDITHVISDNLEILGTPGGPLAQQNVPEVGVVTLGIAADPGTLSAGIYNYKLVFVDAAGNESPSSSPTSSLTVGADSAIQLNTLPNAPNAFTARRIYRSDSSGSTDGAYTLVDQINASDSSYTDTGATLGGDILQVTRPSSGSVFLSSITSGTLPAGTYNYRVTFVDIAGNEGPSSDPTSDITVPGAPFAGGIVLANLPTPTPGFVSMNVYRSDRTGNADGTYTLISSLSGGTTFVTDSGFSQFLTLQPSVGDRRARLDARLSIDAGTVVKVNGGAIEVTMGADFIAEGTDGSEVIFTSILDDRYGAGGTFDSTSNGSDSVASPGDWAGIMLGHLSSGSLDHTVVSFAGGIRRVAGTFAGFNAVEIHQSDTRIANSVFENNADGTGGQDTGGRDGHGDNAPGLIFIRGAQPVIIDNVMRDNAGPIINVNANALNHTRVTDPGRETGLVDRQPGNFSNQGPLITGNRLTGNELNGLQVRGASLTTESVWDDTNIVHIVQNETIYVTDFHSYGGLRLESSANESLVVKLAGANSGFAAVGRPLDIDDRIGGAVQIVGQPGFPVVLTSLADDTVGAGHQPDGTPLLDTDNAVVDAAPGDWNSILIGQFSHDRNVDVLTEREFIGISGGGGNSTTGEAQYLGNLAPHEKGGDDVRRLGFILHGELSTNEDVDVYSFNADSGTEVWFDIDRTTHSLDTVIELVDANGRVLAVSDNTLAEEADPSILNDSRDASVFDADQVNSLQKTADAFAQTNQNGLPLDRGSSNPRDAGMRVVLPGPSNTNNVYHVRVRNAAGQSAGGYQLQVRLQEADEVPGSTVQFSDIRFATDAVVIAGQPIHSPFIGEAGEIIVAGNDINGNGQTADPTTTAQQLGNLLNSDMAAISLAGELSGITDVDWYTFDVEYDSISGPGQVLHSSVTLDVDYAGSDFGRPDTSIYVFDANGALILVSRGANIADDQSAPLLGADLDDLSRGSTSPLDPFLGPIELPTNNGTSGTYYVAITGEGQVLDQLNPNNNPLLRIEPINSVVRIAEDRIDSSGGSTIANSPIVPLLFDEDSPVEFTLGDVELFVSTTSTNNNSVLTMVDPFTGVSENVIGRFAGQPGDFSAAPDGRFFAFPLTTNMPADANTGGYIQIDPSNPTTALGTTVSAAMNFATYDVNPMDPAASVVADVGVNFVTSTIAQNGNNNLIGYAIGQRSDLFLNPVTPDDPTLFRNNILYLFDPNSGAGGMLQGEMSPDPALAISGAQTQLLERAVLDTTSDPLTNNSQLIVPSATSTNLSSTLSQVTDGMTFQIIDDLGNTTVFELNSGPEVLVSHDPVNGTVIADGDAFRLGNSLYSFDTGAVIVVDAFGGFGIQDSDIVTISRKQNQFTEDMIFEFNDGSGPAVASDRVAVEFQGFMSQNELVNTLVDAINSTSFGVTATILPNSNRITLVDSDSSYEQPDVTTSSLGISISGSRGGAGTAISVEETFDTEEFAAAISDAISTPLLVASAAGNRVNFSGALSADFTDVVAKGIFTEVFGSDGTVSFPNVPVNFLVADSGTTLAQTISEVIADQTTAVATSTSSTVDLPFGWNFVTADSPLRIGGTAPGGDITGLTTINGTLYGVTSGSDGFGFPFVIDGGTGGGLYRIDGATGRGAVAVYIDSASDLLTGEIDAFGTPTGSPIQFTGLTAGPDSVEDGRYAEMLFGIDVNGRIYAFDTEGSLQPIFADGATSVSTGLFGVQGLAFSNLDTNLWHSTLAQNTVPGHGYDAAFDFSRGDEANNANRSLYFGYENANAQPQLGTGSAAPTNTGNYNFPGGAQGSIVSNEFSLVGYSAVDQPALYFNYSLDTEDAQGNLTNEDMRDAFRVFIGGDDGAWSLLATNNSYRQNGPFNDEFDHAGYVRELFDNSGWLQSRVDLSAFAGLDNLRLRFDFSTAGSMGAASITEGDEIRAIAGSELADGQTFTVSDGGFFGTTETFEIELGFTLLAPSAGEVDEGDTFTINGTTFQFDGDNTFNEDILLTPASDLSDGDNFTVGDGVAEAKFEFDEGLAIIIPNVPANDFGGVQDGDTLTIDDGEGDSVIFEFDSDDITNPLSDVIVSVGNSSQNVIASRLGDAINQGILGLDLTPTNLGNGVLHLGGLNHTVDVSDSPNLTVSGTPNVRDPNAIRIAYVPNWTADELAVAVSDAINASGLNVTSQPNGSLVELNEAIAAFNPGTSPLTPNGNFSVPFNPSMTSAEIAGSIERSILRSGLVEPPVIIASGVTESNDTIATSIDTTLGGRPGSYQGDFILGDNTALVTTQLDVDMFRLNMATGDTLTIDTDTPTSTVDTLLRVFDAQGNEVAVNDDGSAPGEFGGVDSFLSYTATAAGDFYIGVSTFANFNYDPTLEGSGASAFSEGAYSMGITLTTSGGLISRAGNQVNIPFATSVSAVGMPDSFISGRPGTNGTPINVNVEMTAEEVADAIAASMAGRFGGSVESIPIDNNMITVVNRTVTDAGPFGLVTSDFFGFPQNGLDGDIFGSFEREASPTGGTGNGFPGALRALDNDHAGVFVDDIIIGFAERGEMVTSGGQFGTPLFTTNNNASPPAIVAGPYQLEIRRSEEFGLSAGIPSDPALILSELFGGRSFDTNGRLDQGSRMHAPSGSNVTEGRAFTISDGTAVVTFEYDDVTIGDGVAIGNVAVPFAPTDPDYIVAASIRDTINSGVVQSILDLQASSTDGTLTGTLSTSRSIDLHGNAVIDGFSDGVEATEGNETSLDAVETGIVGRFGTFLGLGAIGDNENITIPANEVDVFHIELLEADTVLIDVDAFTIGSGLDTYIRVFDSNGFEVENNNDDDETTDSFLEFTAPLSGEYFVGVSANFNRFYDPNIEASGASGFSEGNYQISISPFGSVGGSLASLQHFDDVGDSNRERPQGQVLIHSNSISNSSNFGVQVQPGARDRSDIVPLAGQNPDPGAPRILAIENSHRWVPGVSISNNIISGSGDAAIQFAGDAVTGADTAAVPFGRIVNNTLVGSVIPGLPVGPETANGLLIDNDVDPAIPGHIEYTPGPGGNAVNSGVTVQGNNTLFTNAEFFFAFGNIIDVGSNGGAIDLGTSTITLQPTLISPDVVASEGNFAGANGTVNWRVESSIENGESRLTNTVTFSSATPFGDVQFINYLDQDVNGITDDLISVVGTPGEDDFRVFTLDNPERVGFGQGGIYQPGPGLVNATYSGWAADQWPDLIADIAGPGVNFTVAGNVDTTALPPFVDPNLGAAFGLNDTTSAFAWNLDPAATTATVTSFMELAGVTPGDTGVRVIDNASPTLLNNIFSNLGVGIDVDLSSSTTVVGGSLYHENENNVLNSAVEGDFALYADDGTELFVDWENGNFYPVEGSLAIDSSIDSLEDRAPLVDVGSPLGIELSPILAPNFDATGQLRVDDPSVAPPIGVGRFVFKDRGALDRSDFTGPSGRAIAPLDNDAEGVDQDPNENFIEVVNVSLNNFEIQLFDGVDVNDPVSGSGISDSTVNSNTVIIFQEGVRLVEGVDYSFTFDPTNNTIRLTPTAGLWSLDTNYLVELINGERHVITAEDGEDIIEGNTFTVFDNEGNSAVFEFDTNYIMQVPLAGGGAGGVTDGETFTVTLGANDPVVFEFDSNQASDKDSFAIAFGDATSVVPSTQQDLVNAIMQALGGAGVVLTPTDLGDGRIHLGATVSHVVDATDSSIGLSGAPGAQTVGALPIPVLPTDSSDEIAAAMVTAINGASGVNVTATAEGETIIVVGSSSVVGVLNEFVTPIQDVAGNALRPNSGDGRSLFRILLGSGIDYGDAPATYPTLGDIGARHLIEAGFHLGAGADPDLNGQPSELADGDDNDDGGDDEDGIVFTSLMLPGESADVEVTTTISIGNGLLDAWIDFNADGDFNDLGEQIFASQSVVDGVNNLTFDVPLLARLTGTYARFRLSTAGNLAPGGFADDGEVEDYRVRIGSVWQNPEIREDVTGDGHISPLDALILINYINLNPLAPNVPPAPQSPPPFYDVNGDNMVTANDVLIVVNVLNDQAAGLGEGLFAAAAASDAIIDAQEEELSEVAVAAVEIPFELPRRLNNAVSRDVALRAVSSEMESEVQEEIVADAIDASAYDMIFGDM
jgi:hypothetical protein